MNSFPAEITVVELTRNTFPSVSEKEVDKLASKRDGGGRGQRTEGSVGSWNMTGMRRGENSAVR